MNWIFQLHRRCGYYKSFRVKFSQNFSIFPLKTLTWTNLAPIIPYSAPSSRLLHWIDPPKQKWKIIFASRIQHTLWWNSIRKSSASVQFGLCQRSDYRTRTRCLRTLAFGYSVEESFWEGFTFLFSCGTLALSDLESVHEYRVRYLISIKPNWSSKEWDGIFIRTLWWVKGLNGIRIDRLPRPDV